MDHRREPITSRLIWGYYDVKVIMDMGLLRLLWIWGYYDVKVIMDMGLLRLGPSTRRGFDFKSRLELYG